MNLSLHICATPAPPLDCNKVEDKNIISSIYYLSISKLNNIITGLAEQGTWDFAKYTITKISNQGDSPMIVFGGYPLIFLFSSSPGPIQTAKHTVQQIEKNPQQNNQTEAYYGCQ